MSVQLLESVEEAYEPDNATVEARDAFTRLKLVMTGADPDPITLTPPAPKVVVKRVLPDREILTAMTAVGSLLTVRLMLMLSVVGAFALAWRVMEKASWLGLAVLFIYALMTVSPLVILSTKRT